MAASGNTSWYAQISSLHLQVLIVNQDKVILPPLKEFLSEKQPTGWADLLKNELRKEDDKEKTKKNLWTFRISKEPDAVTICSNYIRKAQPQSQEGTNYPYLQLPFSASASIGLYKEFIKFIPQGVRKHFMRESSQHPRMLPKGLMIWTTEVVRRSSIFPDNVSNSIIDGLDVGGRDPGQGSTPTSKAELQ